MSVRRTRRLLAVAAALTAAPAWPAGAAAAPEPALVVPAAVAGDGSPLRAARGRAVRLVFAVPPTRERLRRAVLRVRLLRGASPSVSVRVAGRRAPVAVARAARGGRWLALDVTRAVRADGRRRALVLVSRRGRLAIASPSARSTRMRPRLELALAAPAAATAAPGPVPPATPPAPAVPPPAPAPPPPAPAGTTAPAPGEPTAAARRLAALVEDVAGADAVRYDARDDGGLPLDTLKVLQVAPRLYAGVYHALVGTAFETYVATSTDLLTWHRQARLDVHASQPTLAELPGGGYVVAYEVDGPQGNGLRVRRYPDLGALLAGRHDREATPPRTLSPAAEGTPSLLTATAGGERLEIGFHRFRDADVDRQASGVLEGWGAWSAAPLEDVDARFEALGTGGNLGDRDHVPLPGGGRADLIEAQAARGDWASWRLWLHEPATGGVLALAPRTHGGSTALGNPTATRVVLSDGDPGLVVTAFVFGEGAAAGEAGSLVFVHRLGEGDL